MTWLDLSMLLHSLASTHCAVLALHQAQERLIDNFQREQLRSLSYYGLRREDSAQLAFAIDAFLDSGRRTQYAILPYLSRAFGKSLKQSLNDVVKDLRSGKVSLEPSLDQLLVRYWQNGGEKLKHYRDVAQHHALIAADARIFLSAEGDIGLHLMLPSNPEAKSTSALTFGTPPVHAVPYVRGAYLQLLCLLAMLSSFLVDHLPSSAPKAVEVSPFQPLVFGQDASLQGHKCFRTADLTDLISGRIALCEEQYQSTNKSSASMHPNPSSSEVISRHKNVTAS